MLRKFKLQGCLQDFGNEIKISFERKKGVESMKSPYHGDLFDISDDLSNM